MHLVEILLPLYDNAGRAQPPELFRETERDLVEQFGGVTAFLRAPAQGKWQKQDGSIDRDEIVICEVMTDELDRAWWKSFRRHIAARFQQEELVMRAFLFEEL